MPKQLTPARSPKLPLDSRQPGANQQAPESSESRGPCTVCGQPVLVSQEREKDKDGNYSHVVCNQKAGTPPIASKGPCSLCGKQVLASEERVLNADRTYRHLHCQTRRPHAAQHLETLPPRREAHFQTTCVSSVELPGSRKAVLTYGTEGEAVLREFYLVERAADDVPCAVSYRPRGDVDVAGISSATPLHSAELRIDGASVTLHVSRCGIFVLCKMLAAVETFWIDFVAHGVARDADESRAQTAAVWLHATVFPYTQWVDDREYYQQGAVQQQILIPKLGFEAKPKLTFTLQPTDPEHQHAQALLQLLLTMLYDDAQPSFLHFFSSLAALGSRVTAVAAALCVISGDEESSALVSAGWRQLSPVLEDLPQGQLAKKKINANVLSGLMAAATGEDHAAFVQGLQDREEGGGRYDLAWLVEEWAEVDGARNRQLAGKGLLGSSAREVAEHCLQYGLWKRPYESLLRSRDALAALRERGHVPQVTWGQPTLSLVVSPVVRLLMFRNGLAGWEGDAVCGIVQCHRVAEAILTAETVAAPSDGVLGRLEAAFVSLPFADERHRREGIFGVFNALSGRSLTLPDFRGAHDGSARRVVVAAEGSCGFESVKPFHSSRPLEPLSPDLAMPHHVRLTLREGTATLVVVVVTKVAHVEDGKQGGEPEEVTVHRAKELWVSVSSVSLRRQHCTRSGLFTALVSQLTAHLEDSARDDDGGGSDSRVTVHDEALQQSVYRALSAVPGGMCIPRDCEMRYESEEEGQVWLEDGGHVSLLADALDDEDKALQLPLRTPPGPSVFRFF